MQWPCRLRTEEGSGTAAGFVRGKDNANRAQRQTRGQCTRHGLPRESPPFAKITIFTEMKKWLLILVMLAAVSPGVRAQGGRGFWHQEWAVEKGDSVPLVHILPVYVFSRPVDLRRYRKLVDAVKKVYPIAKVAKARMADMEEELCRLPTKKAQKEYIRQVYHQIKDEYTPVLKHMTRTQGKVLLKLIDRETEYTAYEVLKEFRGGFVAGFWQGVSRIFGQNLKSQYDRDNEDKMIEQIVIYYEAGLLR